MSKRVKNIIRIAILFVLLLLPIFVALFTAIDLEYSLLKKLAYLIVVCLLLALPATFLKARVYFIVEGVLNFLFFPIDIASLYLNRQSCSTAFLQNIFHTDWHEALELVASMWPFALVVVLLWVLYFVLAARVENKMLLPKKVRRAVYIGLPIACVAGIIAMMIHLKRIHPERSVGSMTLDAVGLVEMKLYKIYPYNLYLETYDIINNTYRQRQFQKEVTNFQFGISTQKGGDETIYVFVIGEASRYDHWSLHGYNRETTPLLAQCANIVSFDSAFSQANLTGYSVPLILTRATADNAELAFQEKSIPEAFQEAGYKVGVITKQIPSMLVERIMQNCDKSYFNAKGIDVEGNYDEEMIPLLGDYIRDSIQFAVLHSLGCHFRYELRYPAEFARFQPTFGTAFSYSLISEENKELLVNAYDNAILYTDYFLGNLIHYLDSLDCPAVMLFMSDHGESFWDDERKLSLHGSYQISEYEYHVPLVVWYSDEYAAQQPQKVQAMKQNKTTPVSSDVVFYSLLDLAGIEDIVDSTRSICSPALQPQETFWVTTGSGEVVRTSFR